MAPLSNHGSSLQIGNRWDDGFINQRLLGLGVVSAATGVLLGLKQLIGLMFGS
jgi:hypothetical protein